MSDTSNQKIDILCPHCRKTLRVPREALGKKVRCTGCNEIVRIPQVAPLRPEEDDWLNLDAPALSPDAIKAAKPEKKAAGYVWEKKSPAPSAKESTTKELTAKAPVASATHTDAPVANATGSNSPDAIRSPSITPRANEVVRPVPPSSTDLGPLKIDDLLLDDENPNGLSNPTDPEYPTRKSEPVRAEVPLSQLPPLPFDDQIERIDPPVKPKPPVKSESPVQSSFDDDDFMTLEPVIEVRKPKVNTEEDWLDSEPAEQIESSTAPAKRTPAPIHKSALTIDSVDSMSDQPLRAKRRQEEIDDAEFPLKCKVCGTLLYAQLSQVGHGIRCPDCFVEIMVPNPPKNWSPLKAKSSIKPVEADPDLPLAQAEERPKPLGDLMDRSAREMLQKAKQAVEEEADELKEITYDFDTKNWLIRTFSFLRDPILILIAVFTGLGFGIILGAARYFGLAADATHGFSVALQFLVLGGGGIPLLTVSLANGLAILQASANRLAAIPEWPVLNPGEWLAESFLVFLSFLLAAAPGAAIGTLMSTLGQNSLLGLGAVILTTWLLFPPFLLGMLDNQSFLKPISREVFDSMKVRPDAWGAMYMTSGIVAVGLFLIMITALTGAPIYSFFFGVLVPFFLFFIFHQFGILAARITDLTSLGFDESASDSNVVN